MTLFTLFFKLNDYSCFDGEIIASGTSLAVPHVVGVAAMLWGRDLSKSNEFIRQLINATAKEAGGKEEYGHGIVDAGYAMEIYDLFAEAYTERKNLEDITKEIGENEIPIETFDIDGYIEGRWKDVQHNESAEQGGYITGKELVLLKKSANISDNNYNLPHMYQNPQFHGFFGSNWNTNYISCYLLLMKMANLFANNDLNNYKNPNQIYGISSSDYNAIISKITNVGIGGTSWNSILNDLGSNIDNTKRARALVIYGIALHTATDIFAHSAFVDGKHINHDSHLKSKGELVHMADDIEHYPNRIRCAKAVAKQTVYHCKYNDAGSLSDFAISSDIYKGKFKLEKFSYFANSADSNFYYANRTLFDNININYKN